MKTKRDKKVEIYRQSLILSFAQILLKIPNSSFTANQYAISKDEKITEHENWSDLLSLAQRIVLNNLNYLLPEDVENYITAD